MHAFGVSEQAFTVNLWFPPVRPHSSPVVVKVCMCGKKSVIALLSARFVRKQPRGSGWLLMITKGGKNNTWPRKTQHCFRFADARILEVIASIDVKVDF